MIDVIECFRHGNMMDTETAMRAVPGALYAGAVQKNKTWKGLSRPDQPLAGLAAAPERREGLRAIRSLCQCRAAVRAPNPPGCSARGYGDYYKAVFRSPGQSTLLPTTIQSVAFSPLGRMSCSWMRDPTDGNLRLQRHGSSRAGCSLGAAAAGSLVFPSRIEPARGGLGRARRGKYPAGRLLYGKSFLVPSNRG